MTTLFLIKPSASYNSGPDLIESFLSSLKKILGEKPFSFEINSIKKQLFFTARIEVSMKDIFRSQLYSFWPDFEISEIEECISTETPTYAAYIVPKQRDMYLLKTYTSCTALPLAQIYNFLLRLDAEESVSLQYLIIPTDSSTSAFQHMLAKRLQKQKRYDSIQFFKRWKEDKYSKENLHTTYTAIATKNSTPLYWLQMRIIAQSTTFTKSMYLAEQLRTLLAPIESSFAKLHLSTYPWDHNAHKAYTQLYVAHKHTYTLGEIATLFHFPRTQEKLPGVLKVISKKAEPPLNLPGSANTLPEELCLIGKTTYRDAQETFGITYEDRARHTYIIGKSGSGKSKLIELMIQNDIRTGKGIGLIDPHGDVVDHVLTYVPLERKQDVIIVDPSDTEYPVAFNPLEKVPAHLRLQTAAGLLEIFKKSFGAQWSSRIEHVLRFILLALLDTPKSTLLDIIRILTDREFRQYTIGYIEDDIVKKFWMSEFSSWSERFESEAIMPIINKIGQFLSNKIIRNIVCQVESKLSIKEAMDSKKILLLKLSKGILGEENSALLGSIFITRIQQTAMERAAQGEDGRIPFYLYVDEFQNFATDTFANILSEARKYKLSLTISHQYIEQLSPTLQATVFGNVGTIIAFRIGPKDAQVMEKEFAPAFQAEDLVFLGTREMSIKMTIHGEYTQAFSARSLDVVPSPTHVPPEELVDFSRKHYATSLEELSTRNTEEDSTEALLASLKNTSFDAPLI